MSIVAQCHVILGHDSLVHANLVILGHDSLVHANLVILLCFSVTDHQSTSHREAELVTLRTVSYGTLTVSYGQNFLA
jgi:hypothetical protein